MGEVNPTPVSVEKLKTVATNFVTGELPQKTVDAIERALQTRECQVLLAYIFQEGKWQVPVDKADFKVQQFVLKIAGKLGCLGRDYDAGWPVKTIRFGLGNKSEVSE